MVKPNTAKDNRGQRGEKTKAEDRDRSDQACLGRRKSQFSLNNVNDRRQRGDASSQRSGKKDESAENDEDPHEPTLEKSRVSTLFHGKLFLRYDRTHPSAMFSQFTKEIT